MKTLALLEGRTNPLAQRPYNALGEEERAAALRVMDSRNLSGFVGRAGDAFLGGPEVIALEDAFCKRFHVSHAVSFNSATTALQAAVAALGIGPGDEVITTPYTMSASATCVLLNGAVPVFADIDERTFCLDPASVERRITPRTKAILAVNLFGGSADYQALGEIAKRHHLKIIEDNAQAPGATCGGILTGTIGDVGIFSLNVHKVMQCGEGGVLVCNDKEIAYRAQLVRNHGEVIVDDLDGVQPFEALAGNNYRMSEIHAAIASEQLKKLDDQNGYRQTLAARLTEGMRHLNWLVPCEPTQGMTHVYYLYPFRFLSERAGFSRDTFARAMKAEGFPVPQGYVKPIYLMPLYQQKRMYPRSQFPFVSTEYPTNVSYDRGICPVTERLWEHELLTTTVYQPPNTAETVDQFLDVLLRIDAQRDTLRTYEASNA